MKFELYGLEEMNYEKWLEEHGECPKRHEYHGAIGIGDTFIFTTTSLGRVVKVECVCGKQQDITDYECW